MSAHPSAGRSHCQNCGSPLAGPYCSTCGQHDVDYHRSVGPILEDSLEGFLHLDGKFFRTVRWLFTRPGFLTNEFNAGRRNSYTQPLRLYIFASFLYFAFTVFQYHEPVPAGAATPREASATVVSPAPAGAKPPGVEGLPPALRPIVARLTRGDRREIARGMQHLVPTMAFFCLPLLGTVLLLTHRRSGKVYVEHMIFALHIQAFYFLAALAARLVGAGLGLFSEPLVGLSAALFFLGGAYSIYLAFRRVYGEGRWKTAGKLALVGFIYGIVLIVGITAALLASAGA